MGTDPETGLGKARQFKQWKVGIASNLAPERGPEDERQFIYLELVFKDDTHEAFPFGLVDAKLLHEQLGERIVSLESSRN